jgi:hypothetical protein
MNKYIIEGIRRAYDAFSRGAGQIQANETFFTSLRERFSHVRDFSFARL